MPYLVALPKVHNDLFAYNPVCPGGGTNWTKSLPPGHTPPRGQWFEHCITLGGREKKLSVYGDFYYDGSDYYSEPVRGNGKFIVNKNK